MFWEKSREVLKQHARKAWAGTIDKLAMDGYLPIAIKHAKFMRNHLRQPAPHEFGEKKLRQLENLTGLRAIPRSRRRNEHEP
jgi:hypothetical protein